jgi:hypothetical protein
VFVFVLSLAVCMGESSASSSSEAAPAKPADQAAGRGGGDSSKCPLRAADLDKLTPYRWKFAQYRADQSFMPSNGKVRIDYCELIGSDATGKAVTAVMVNIASGVYAEAFARHWNAACADSLNLEMRGKVQPIPGVAGGHQCVTAKGTSSFNWIELPGRTIEIMPLDDEAFWAKIFPQLLAAVAR